MKPGARMMPAIPVRVAKSAPPTETRVHLSFGMEQAQVAWHDGARCENIREDIRRRFGLVKGAEFAIVDADGAENARTTPPLVFYLCFLSRWRCLVDSNILTRPG